MSILKDAFGFLVGWLIDVPEQEYRGTELTKAATDDYIKKVYGTVRQQAGTIIFKRTNDADNDKIKNDLLHIVIVWAEECASVSECYIDDIPASSNNAIFFAKKNKRVVYAVNFPNGMDGYTSAQLNAAGWTNTDKCEGKACTYVVLEAHKGDNAITSEPSLKADLVGTTTSNPAAILKDYLKDPINGKGLDDTYLNLPAFSSVEAFCDSQVETYTGSGVYRNLFTCNIALDTSQTILQNTNDILRTFRGLLPILDGKLTPIVEKDDPVVSLEITEEDIDELGPIRNSSKKDRYNQVIVTYYDAEADGTAQEAVYPEVDSATDIAWLAADNGVRLERTVDLKGCNNYYEALAFAKILAEISREQLSTTITIKGIWATLFEVGDIVNVSHSYPGWEQKPFRITNTTEKMDEVELTLREHQPYIYDYFGEGNKPEIPDTSIDDSPPAVPADLTITHSYDNFKQVRVSWVSDAARFDYQVIDENDNVLEADRTALNYVDLKGYALGTYTFRVAAIGGLSRSSGWAEITITLQVPGVPSSLTVNASNFTLECIANLQGADSATQFEYALTPANQTADPTDVRGPAAAYTFQGLAPNTQYKVWARSHNALGTSGWISQLETTGLKPEDLTDLVANVVLPESTESIKDKFSGIASDLQQASDQYSQTSGDYTLLSQALISLNDDVGLVKLDVQTLLNAKATFDAEITLTNFLNAGFGYEDELGDWHEGAAFARAFDEIRIERPSGSFVSVYDYVNLLETRTGDLEGLYQFGVETYNSFTGIEIKSGTSDVSSIRLFMDNLTFASKDGRVGYQYSAALGRHIWYGATVHIGTNEMSVEDFDQPFGPDNLTYWRGPVLLNMGEPDLSQLIKANATEWRDDTGAKYTAGDFTAKGVLESSALKAGSGIILNDEGLTGPPIIYTFASSRSNDRVDRTLVMPTLYGPGYVVTPNVAHSNYRLSYYNMDMFLKVLYTKSAGTSTVSNYEIEVKYTFQPSDPSGPTYPTGHNQWVSVLYGSVNPLHDYASVPLIYRYTTRSEPWDTLQIRILVTSASGEGKPLSVLGELTVFNQNRSSNTPGSISSDSHDSPGNEEPDYDDIYVPPGYVAP